MVVPMTLPVEEAEYQIRRKDKLGFYDCLRPRLRVIRKRVKRRKTNEFGEEVDDIANLIEENDDLWAQVDLLRE